MRPIGLKACQTAWKLAEWFANNPNGMKAVQAYQTNCPWPEQHESWPNDLYLNVTFNCTRTGGGKDLGTRPGMGAYPAQYNR